MASYQYVYVMKNLTKIYPGGRKVLEGIFLSFYPGAKIGVLGPNGSGKSTLMRIMAGQDTDFSGEAWAAQGATVGYLEQEPQLDASKNVQENVLEGLAATKALVDRFTELSLKLGEVEDPDEMTRLIDEQAALQEQIDTADAWDLDRTVDIAMDALRCPPGDASVEHLSGGEKRRVALARLLLQKPDLLLLDEPTNHPDLDTRQALTEALSQFEGTLVLVSRGRPLLRATTDQILIVADGTLKPFDGDLADYRGWLFKTKLSAAA